MRNSLSTMFEHSELVEHSWPWAYPALCISCGYFAYDQWDMLLHHLYKGWIPFILVHHLLLLVCFTLALYRNVTINYLILTLVCEVSFGMLSIFLHTCKNTSIAAFCLYIHERHNIRVFLYTAAFHIFAYTESAANGWCP